MQKTLLMLIPIALLLQSCGIDLNFRESDDIPFEVKRIALYITVLGSYEYYLTNGERQDDISGNTGFSNPGFDDDYSPDFSSDGNTYTVTWDHVNSNNWHQTGSLTITLGLRVGSIVSYEIRSSSEDLDNDASSVYYAVSSSCNIPVSSTPSNIAYSYRVEGAGTCSNVDNFSWEHRYGDGDLQYKTTEFSCDENSHIEIILYD
ncbi:MAG: hypothetical protein HN352_15940 [Bacteroidetes bacterium]|jgi:hypothetical protein|nr:hypothetical protein [Bacteroidota bacterium]MBT4398701.1 hypothetical protein [Bacteroidota bacterium]MBT4412334.1 hypothetical protein [Bacteroidota bacterium]MBT7094803.1 hypothetical protein [Bacteroidota bacterium]MBT7465445.1 hypothetical protein [Bacteroidota bacterium]